MREFQIAVFPGDGIGGEVMQPCVALLETVTERVGGFALRFAFFEAGAELYRRTGEALPAAALQGAEAADAILLGAMGLPDVRYPDGTEVAPHLDFRDRFGLYAGVRPIRVLPGAPTPLADPRAARIDCVLIRESTEGLFASRKMSRRDGPDVVLDTLRVSRGVTERLCDFAFRLARQRRTTGSAGRVTCVDKANVLPSMAFFRSIFLERAARHPDIAADCMYVDATALRLVRAPWEFDVMVTENMFGDILSDLGAALMGGMGMAPSADVGDRHAVFQPCHGTAPDIAGRGVANPTAMFLSAAMMLEWLGELHDVNACRRAGARADTGRRAHVRERHAAPRRVRRHGRHAGDLPPRARGTDATSGPGGFESLSARGSRSQRAITAPNNKYAIRRTNTFDIKYLALGAEVQEGSPWVQQKFRRDGAARTVGQASHGCCRRRWQCGSPVAASPRLSRRFPPARSPASFKTSRASRSRGRWSRSPTRRRKSGDPPCRTPPAFSTSRHWSSGRYKVSVSLPGFSTVERVDIQLQSNETHNAGIVTLRAGITETLTVTADPIGVQTSTAVRTSVLDTSTIDTMVSRGRDPVRLLNSLPGVDPNIGGLITGGTIGTNLPTMQGTAGFASYIAIDGVGSSDGDTGNNNGITSMDAIQEIRVVMNSYTAEFGRNTGPQINVVTKSGGQRYSGSLSTYIRHEALNSNTLANERLGLPKPIARFYTGVGTIGGPVALPGIGKLKRTFFFYTREMWDTKQPSSPNTKQMPTTAERNGDFSQTTQTNGAAFFIRDPLLSGACSPTAGGPACFPGNIIPADRIDPLGRAVVNLFPAPNFFDVSVSNRQYNFADTDIPNVYRTLDQVTIDHNFTDNDRVSAKYRHWRPNREATTGTFGINSNWNHFRGQYAQKEDAVTVNYTRMMTGQLVNEMSFGYRNTPEVAPVDTMPDPIAKLQREPNGLGALGSLYNTPTLNQLSLYPQLTFTGVPGTPPNVAWDARFPIDAIDLRWSLQNNVTWTAGRHLREGGPLLRVQHQQRGLQRDLLLGLPRLHVEHHDRGAEPLQHESPLRERAPGVLHDLRREQHPSVPRRQPVEPRVVRSGFVEDPEQPDAGARRALRLGDAVAPEPGRVEGLQPAGRPARSGMAGRGLRSGDQSRPVRAGVPAVRPRRAPPRRAWRRIRSPAPFCRIPSR